MRGAVTLGAERCSRNAFALGVRTPGPSRDWAGVSHTPKGGLHFMAIK